jgi:hypothetical protein
VVNRRKRREIEYVLVGKVADAAAEQEDRALFWNFQPKSNEDLLTPSTCQKVHKHNTNTYIYISLLKSVNDLRNGDTQDKSDQSKAYPSLEHVLNTLSMVQRIEENKNNTREKVLSS